MTLLWGAKLFVGAKMNQQLISIIDIAKNHGKRPQSIHKLVKSLGFETSKQKGDGSRGQQVSCITLSDYEELKMRLDDQSDRRMNFTDDGDSIEGAFYIISLEPELDPGRIKVGFTRNMIERLRHHRISAPFAEVVKTWPCKSLWEKTAIDCVTQDCEKINTEVFRTDDVERIVFLADKFFALMPQ